MGWVWRLSGVAPWDLKYIDDLATLMERTSAASIINKRSAVPAAPREFDRTAQVERVTMFIEDLLNDEVRYG
jgi:hypothetical protein